MSPLIPQLTAVIDSLIEFKSELLKADAPPISTPPVTGLVPTSVYRLPAESNDAITKVYGRAAKEMSLEWFSFPTDKIRLYDRNGAELKSHVGDTRDDHRTHPLLTTRITNALAEIYWLLGEEEFIRQGWHVYGGSHNYRTKTGGSSLSTHAWAAAFDFNPSENNFAKRTTTFSDVAIDVMEKWGFLSGGRAWGKDWMHFQAVIPNVSSGTYYADKGLPKNILVA
jgi:hypothetical protein